MFAHELVAHKVREPTRSKSARRLLVRVNRERCRDFVHYRYEIRERVVVLTDVRANCL